MQKPWDLGVVQDSTPCGWEDHHEKSLKLTMMMACSAWVQKYEDDGHGCYESDMPSWLDDETGAHNPPSR